MFPIDIACRHVDVNGMNCGAQSKQSCIDYLDDYRIVKNAEFHHERIEDAAAMTRVSDPVDEKNFDEAVEESGLV